MFPNAVTSVVTAQNVLSSFLNVYNCFVIAARSVGISQDDGCLPRHERAKRVTNVGFLDNSANPNSLAGTRNWPLRSLKTPPGGPSLT